jgi:hypothetical protein
MCVAEKNNSNMVRQAAKQCFSAFSHDAVQESNLQGKLCRLQLTFYDNDEDDDDDDDASFVLEVKFYIADSLKQHRIRRHATPIGNDVLTRNGCLYFREIANTNFTKLRFDTFGVKSVIVRTGYVYTNHYTIN